VSAATPERPPLSAGNVALPMLRQRLNDLLHDAKEAKLERGRTQMLFGLAMNAWAVGGKTETLHTAFCEAKERFDSACRRDVELQREIVVARSAMIRAGFSQ
jgi:hypothetical protein